IGPAVRSAGMTAPPKFTTDQKVQRCLYLAGQTDILLQPCDFAAEFIEHQIARAALHDKNTWLTLGRAEFKTTQDVQRLFDHMTSPGVQIAWSFALLRTMLAEPAGQTFINAPNIIQR